MLLSSGTAELPDRYDPMVIKEIRQGLRARRFALPFMLVHIAATVAFAYEYFSMNVGDDAAPAVWMVAGAMMLVIMPLTGLGAMNGELEGRNFELILFTDMTRWRVARGKWLSAAAQGWLVFASILPYIIVRYFLGGIELTETLVYCVFLLSGHAALTSLAVGAAGFETVGKRISMLLGAWAGAGTCLGVCVAIAWSAMFEAGSQGILWGLGNVLGFIAIAAAFVLGGMQLVRGAIRAFVHPLEPPPRANAVALVLLSPFIIFATALITCGTAPFTGGGLLFWIFLRMDPERRAALPYNRPIPPPTPPGGKSAFYQTEAL